MKRILKFIGRAPQIYKDTGFVFVGNLFSALLAFIFSVFVSRSLGPAEFGVFSVALAVLTMISDISDFGANTGMVKFTSLALEKGQNSRAGQIINLNFRFKIFWGVLLGAAGYFLAPAMALYFFNNPALAQPLKISFLGILGILLFSFMLAVFQAFKKFGARILLSLLLGGFRVVLLLILFGWGSFNLTNSLWVYILVPLLLLGLAVVILPLKFFKEKPQDSKLAQELFHFSKWLTISNLCVLVTSRLDIFLLARLAGDQACGLYNSAYRLASFILLINSSFTVTLLPEIFRLNDPQLIKGYFKKFIRFTLTINFCLVPLIFLAPLLIKVIYGSAYLGAVSVFQILVVAFMAIVVLSALEMIIYALNRPDLFAILMMLSLILSLAGNYLLIPILKENGAAWVLLSVKIFGIIYLAAAILVIFMRNKKSTGVPVAKDLAEQILTQEETAALNI